MTVWHRATVRRHQGFTLIEILVVIIIIGVLAAVAVPVFLNQRDKAARAATKANQRNLIAEVTLARESKGTTLYGVTGNGCTDCTCRTLTPIPKVTDPGFATGTCGQAWKATAAAIATASGSTPAAVEALMTDGWGRPLLIDENEGTNFGCGAPDTLRYADRDGNYPTTSTYYNWFPASGLC